MRSIAVGTSVLWIAFGSALALPQSARAADTHTIVAQANLTWKYGTKVSTPTSPVLVDDLKIGDIVEISIPGGQHGFVTIKKTPAPTKEVVDVVLACGESPASKPNAVLKEIECGPKSKFNVPFIGNLKLEVLPTFASAQDFYCVIHKGTMPGILKLKSAARH
jgi:hypothetical protein